MFYKMGLMSITDLEPPDSWRPIDFPTRNPTTLQWENGKMEYLNHYYCDECDFSTTNKFDFISRHINTEKHKENMIWRDAKTLKECKHCNEKFSPHAFNRHNATNEKLHKNLDAGKITKQFTSHIYTITVGCNNYYVRPIRQNDGEGQRIYPLLAMWLYSLMKVAVAEPECGNKDDPHRYDHLPDTQLESL